MRLLKSSFSFFYIFTRLIFRLSKFQLLEYLTPQIIATRCNDSYTYQVANLSTGSLLWYPCDTEFGEMADFSKSAPPLTIHWIRQFVAAHFTEWPEYYYMIRQAIF